MFEDFLFEELENILSPHYQLVRDKLEIMHVDVTLWCQNNPRLVGRYGSSQARFNLSLPIPTCRSPDACVILATRWNALSQNDQTEAYSSVPPNFVAEIRSNNDPEDYCHQKLLDYMDADVEEAIP
ncbi:hypothetical protein C1645_823796 [Glomus cerebriforme]|uniref:Putative restriction endonuclease domain-containing protein n=1 Tax=Glomus cerebriforme TaxID=658196 RepID=A0A397T4P9_9GLOM|nr:hypothetical protein C1645_823796 [Glomus cerebriforme]